MKRIKNNNSTVQRTYYNIKKPSSTRRTFQVTEEIRTGSERVYRTIKSEFLDNINLNFKSNKLTLDKAYDAIRTHFDNLRSTLPNFIIEKTDDGLDKHLLGWREELLNKRAREPESDYQIINFSRHMSEILNRANKTIHNVTIPDLRKEIKNQLKPTSSQKKLCFYFNNYLSYSKRDLKLDPGFFRGAEYEFYHVSSRDFEKLILNAPIELKVPMRILFYTGLRAGELYGLRKKDWIQARNSLRVDRQEKNNKDKTIKKPKCNKLRTTVAPKCITEDLEYWFAPDFKKLCRNTFQSSFRKFCNTNKQPTLRIHDLRHSFAMYCLEEKRISISMIAKLIGDRIDICEKHYLGSRLSDETVADIASQFS